MLINTALSLAFVFAAFYGQASIPVLGANGIVPDMAPQTFMVTLMGCLIPGLLTHKRIRNGKLSWHADLRGMRAGHVVLAAVLAAVVMTALIVGSCWLALPHLITGGAAFVPLLLAKAIFGAGLAAVVTPWAIRRVLR